VVKRTSTKTLMKARFYGIKYVIYRVRPDT